MHNDPKLKLTLAIPRQAFTRLDFIALNQNQKSPLAAGHQEKLKTVPIRKHPGIKKKTTKPNPKTNQSRFTLLPQRVLLGLFFSLFISIIFLDHILLLTLKGTLILLYTHKQMATKLVQKGEAKRKRETSCRWIRGLKPMGPIVVDLKLSARLNPSGQRTLS